MSDESSTKDQLTDELLRLRLRITQLENEKRPERYLLRTIQWKDFLLGLSAKSLQLTEKDLYAYVLEQIVKLTESTIGFLHLVSEDQKSIILSTWNSEALKNCNAPYETHYPFEQAGNWVDCVRLKQSVIYNDFPTSPNRKGLPEGHTPIHRFLSIPVIENDQVRIVFGVGNKPGEYDDYDAGQIQLAANDLSLILKQHQQAKKLRESEAQYKILVETAKEGVWSMNADHVTTFLNKAMARMLGYEMEEIIGRKFECFIYEVDSADNHRRMQNRHNGYDECYERRLRRRDGSELWVNISAKALMDQDGNFLGSFGMFTDITERKRNEQALMESEKRFSQFMEYFPGSVYIKDSNRRIIYLTEKVREYFGVDPNEWLGKTSEEIWPSELADKIRREDEAVLQGEFVQSLSDRPHKDGIHTWLVNRFPIYRDNASPLIGCISFDITERKKTEQALAESETRFQRIFEKAPIGIALIDSNTGRFMQINQRYCDIVGYNQGEMLNLDFQSITHRDNLEENLRKMELLRNETISFFTMEKRYYKKKGGEAWVSLTVAPLWKEGESVTQHIAMVTDITEKKQIEEQLFQAQKLEALGTLAGGIAHDFNNALASIIAFAELTMEKLDDVKLRSYLKRILEGSDRAANLVKQILTFSHSQKQEETKLDMKIMTSEAVKLLRSSLPSTIDVRKNFCHEPCFINADLTQIHQLIMNLSTNAAYAMRNRGVSLEVGLSVIQLADENDCLALGLKPGSYVKLSVQDEGDGIDPSIMKTIFEPFFTTKPFGEGTGMGLAVVYGIVKTYDGAIHVASEPGKGSTFSIYLPKADKMDNATQVDTTDAPKGKEKILVVDDEVANGIGLKELLISLGYHAEMTNNSREALEMFSTDPHRFDLLISDVTMPGMTGDQLAIEILKIRPDMSIMLQTGYSERLSEDQCRNIGVRALLMKPLRKANLAAAVRKVLDGDVLFI